MADNTSSWMDFAQRSRDDGGLGLASHQAAGLVGNLQNESGSAIPSWGPTGDNGSAWGSAQWRGDRLDGLKQLSQDNGTDYRTPEAQQAWMRHEMDTTHNGAYKALQASATPEDAANVVNRQYEISADRSGRRGQSARALMDGPTAIETAMGRTPATGSQAMAYDDPNANGALNPAQPPGALTPGGQPQAAKPSFLHSLGMAMMNAAPGLASISSPAQAQALQAAAVAARPAADTGTWSMTNLPDGTPARIHNKTGIIVGLDGKPVTGDHSKETPWVHLGKDASGVDRWGPRPTDEQLAAQKAAAPAAPDTSGLTGPEFMDSLGQSRGTGYQNKVQAIVDGRALIPIGRAVAEGTPGAQMVNDVMQADPTYEQGNAMARQKLRQSFETATGPNSPAVQMRMGGATLNHGGSISDTLEALKGFYDNAGSSIPYKDYYANKLHNSTLAGTGTPEAQAYAAAQSEIDKYAAENAKFMGGGVAGEHEMQRIHDLYDLNKSLPELRSTLEADRTLVHGKADTLQDQWRNGMNNSPLVKDYPVLSKESLAASDKISKRYQLTAQGGYTPPGSTAPASGQKGRQPLSDIFK